MRSREEWDDSLAPAPILAAPPRHPGQRLLVIAALVAAVAVATLLISRGSPAAGPVHHRSTARPPALMRPVATLTDPGGSEVVESLAFSPDGKLLASGDANGATYLRDVATWRVAGTLVDPQGGSDGSYGVSSVAFSPGGTTLATGDEDGRTYLWNVATGRLTATLTDPGGSIVNSVAFSPGGAILATGDWNGRTYLWNVATGRLTATVTDPGRANGVMSVAFSPAGTVLATGDWDGSAHLWNVVTKRLIATVTDPSPGGDSSSVVNLVAFDPGGRTLATADASLYIWDIAEERIATTVTEPGGNEVWSAAFGPDATTVVTGGGPGTPGSRASAYVWDAPAEP